MLQLNMSLDPDEWEDYEDKLIRPSRSGKKHDRPKTESEKLAIIAENQRLTEERQVEAAGQIEEHIEDHFGSLDENERARQVDEYYKWVRASLKAGYADYDEKDVKRESMLSNGPGGQHHQKNETAVRLKHKPTFIEAIRTKEKSQPENLKNAQLTLMQRLEEHLRIWHDTSKDFKLSKGVL